MMQGLYWTEPVPAAVRFGDAMTAETIGDFALATEGAAPIDELRQVEASAATLYFGAWSGRSASTTPISSSRQRLVATPPIKPGLA